MKVWEVPAPMWKVTMHRIPSVSYTHLREKEEDKENPQTAEEPVNEASDEVQESTEE